MEGGARTGGWTFALLFFLVLLPLLPKISRWRHDERYYTDAAIAMRETGDYVTPTYPDGSLRFHKPVLTYWAVAAGHALFGIGFFSSRLFFLVAGAVVVWQTYRLGLLLFRDREAALLGSVVMAANAKLCVCAIRSTPDAPLAVALTASFHGFAALLLRERTERRYLWLAWLGAGFAVAIKGLMGVVPVVFALLWTLARRERLRRLAHLPSMGAGLAVALGWFAAVYALHGPAAIDGFFGDQLSGRVSSGAPYLLENALQYLWGPLVQLLPWTLLVALAVPWHRARLGAFFRAHATTGRFLLWWFVVFWLTFSVADISRARYLLPTFPMLAALIGALLRDLGRDERAARGLRIACRVILAGIALIGLALAAAAPTAGVTIFLLGAVCWFLARRSGFLANPVLVGIALLGAFALTDTLVRPRVFVSPAPEIVARIPGTRDVAYAGVKIHFPSQAHVLSEGRLNPVVLPMDAPDTVLERHDVLVIHESVRDRWNAEGYRVEPCGEGCYRWKPRQLFALLRADDREAEFAKRLHRYYLAVRE